MVLSIPHGQLCYLSQLIGSYCSAESSNTRTVTIPFLQPVILEALYHNTVAQLHYL